MKIDRKKISKRPDNELAALWGQTVRNEYAGGMLLHYLPFVYGVLLDHSGDVATAREDTLEFSRRFSSLLGGYGAGDDFAAWLYGALTAFPGKRRPGGHKKGLTAAQKEYMRRLAAEDEQAVAAFMEAEAGLPKPQRECIRRFFFDRETFETISKHSGYLTDKIRSYVEAGVAEIVPDGDGSEGGYDFRVARLREAYVAYLKGERGDTGAYEVEMESMHDPFLSEAVGGCLRVPGDHARTIAELDREVEAVYFRPRKSRRWLLGVAVLVAVAAGVFVYCTYLRHDSQPVDEVTGDIITVDDPQKPVIPDEYDDAADEAATQYIAPDEPEETTATAGKPSDTPETTAAGSAQVYGPVWLVSVSEDHDAPRDGKTKYVSMPKIGKRGYNEYLKKAAIDLGDGVAGDVTVMFNVNRYGRPSQIRIVEYLTPEAHQEAIRLLEIGPEWSLTEEQVTIVLHFGKP